MTTYKKSNITAKKGINYIKTIVEDSGCLFHKIEQENDLGIDAIIEFIRNEKPAHKSIAVQIKSGPSYYNKNKNECSIPVDSHYDYWINYALPVCGIVYVPEINKGFYINIKTYLKNHGKSKKIKFIANRSNLIDFENFNKLFIPNVLSETPNLSLEEALSFFDSENNDETILGSIVLFKRYVNNNETWDRFINHIVESTAENLDFRILHYLSHIPWHPDIFFTGESIKDEVKKYVKDKINQFDKRLIIKLLSIINEDEGIARGTIGQTVESILSTIDKINLYLEQIILDKEINIEIRHLAATIYAYYNGIKSLKILSQITIEDSWYIPEIVMFVKKYKSYEIYQ